MEQKDFESQCWDLMQEQVSKIDERTKDLPAIRTLLERVLDQTTKTNGNVKELQSWRQRILGGWKLAAILFTIFNSSIVLGAAAYFWNIQENITDEVLKGLEQKYNIDVIYEK
jgi:hypothetical protein